MYGLVDWLGPSQKCHDGQSMKKQGEMLFSCAIIYHHRPRDTTLDVAAERRMVQGVWWLLQDGAYNRSELDKALNEASYDDRNMGIVRMLLVAGADVTVAHEDRHIHTRVVGIHHDRIVVHRNGHTALHAAAASGSVEIARVLIAAGADVHAGDRHGWAVLHEASDYGHIGVVRLLLAAGAHVDQPTGYGWTALMNASRGRVDMVRLLIASGAQTNARTGEGWTALHEASEQGHAEVVRLLLAAGAEANATTTDGWPAHHLASSHGHVDVMRVLLAAGVNVNWARNDGRTALSEALNQHRTEMVDFLRSCGAE